MLTQNELNDLDLRLMIPARHQIYMQNRKIKKNLINKVKLLGGLVGFWQKTLFQIKTASISQILCIILRSAVSIIENGSSYADDSIYIPLDIIIPLSLVPKT